MPLRIEPICGRMSVLQCEMQGEEGGEQRDVQRSTPSERSKWGRGVDEPAAVLPDGRRRSLDSKHRVGRHRDARTLDGLPVRESSASQSVSAVRAAHAAERTPFSFRPPRERQETLLGPAGTDDALSPAPFVWFERESALPRHGRNCGENTGSSDASGLNISVVGVQ